jgi:hypothetical protein
MISSDDRFIELYRKNTAPGRPVVETLERMITDFEQARNEAREACRNGVAACWFAIMLINEARAEPGLPPVGNAP